MGAHTLNVVEVDVYSAPYSRFCASAVSNFLINYALSSNAIFKMGSSVFTPSTVSFNT